ncbi:predicted protein [Histoplasma capsulatum G186AR]|uniref:Uncharacterized protein n=1 Tax=Ajellomyces capsulatus (strain G186AR / H82 / ATCC MYA-2454 / RMSCC 2432) TaxID=447093 RepID=C0NPB9_AJECG|nr:uncharacterized protein HCBG_04999 [Histoplasma capsulatum G186AR]EEH06779.1 predicted protein [Histoplasma capsulatum G186AR]
MSTLEEFLQQIVGDKVMWDVVPHEERNQIRLDSLFAAAEPEILLEAKTAIIRMNKSLGDLPDRRLKTAGSPPSSTFVIRFIWKSSTAKICCRCSPVDPGGLPFLDIGAYSGGRDQYER